MFQRERRNPQQSSLQPQDCRKRTHPCLERMDALEKDGHVLELRLAGNYDRQWTSQPAGGRGARDSQFREEVRIPRPTNVFADPVIVGPTGRLMEVHPSSFRREIAGRKQLPRIEETPARSSMLQMHTPAG